MSRFENALLFMNRRARMFQAPELFDSRGNPVVGGEKLTGPSDTFGFSPVSNEQEWFFIDARNDGHGFESRAQR